MKQKEKKKVTYNQDILELERRRIRAVQKVLDRVKQTEVAKEFKVTEGAISQWMSSYKESGWEEWFKSNAKAWKVCNLQNRAWREAI
ncbi:hypothetical protein ES705_44290 [subsurface metagenome]